MDRFYKTRAQEQQLYNDHLAKEVKRLSDLLTEIYAKATQRKLSKEIP
jgi:hypothetical protein